MNRLQKASLLAPPKSESLIVFISSASVSCFLQKKQPLDLLVLQSVDQHASREICLEVVAWSMTSGEIS